jgi:sRNA-binding carbon storage regulator CsrA
MLVVSRKVNETIEIRPQDGAGPITLAEVFANGAIEISLIRVGTARVKVAINAPPELKIWRREAEDAEPREEVDPQRPKA